MKELSSADIDPADALAPVRSVADLAQLMPCSHDLGRVAKPSTPISDRVRDAPVLSSMVSTAELDRRPSRPADLTAENQALIALAQGDGDLPPRLSCKSWRIRPWSCVARTRRGLVFWRSRTKRDASTGAPLPDNGLRTEAKERRANLAHAARSWIAIPPCSVRTPSAIFPISAKLRRFWKKRC